MGDLHALDWGKEIFGIQHQSPQDGAQVDVFFDNADIPSVIGINFQIAVIPFLDAHIPAQTLWGAKPQAAVAEREKRIGAVA